MPHVYVLFIVIHEVEHLNDSKCVTKRWTVQRFETHLLLLNPFLFLYNVHLYVVISGIEKTPISIYQKKYRLYRYFSVYQQSKQTNA